MTDKLEDWQQNIVARDKLDAMILISRISSWLYPDLAPRDAEQKLLELPEMARLRGICQRKIDRCDKLLREYA